METWTQYTVYFDSLAGYNMVDLHIAIVSTTTSTYNAVYIDEITISDAAVFATNRIEHALLVQTQRK